VGQRSRKRRVPRAGSVATPPAPDPAAPRQPDAPPRGYARSRARADDVRAKLAPLEPGERPAAVLVACAVATLLGLTNLVAFIAGAKINGQRPSFVGILLFSGLMLGAAAGMWRLRYWAILGFQALLALIALTFTLFLLRASNLAAVVLCVVVVGFAGWLFFKLIRTMARIQMPQRRVS
jgi:hypothetical protein